jgi:hypothetical protein
MTKRGYCYLCSETYPEDNLPLRALTPLHKPAPACADHAACDARARAHYRVRAFSAELGRATPPGVCIVAVLLVAGRPVPYDVVTKAARWMRFYEVHSDESAHLRAYASDLAHARASGIIAHDRSAETLAPGERFDVIAASVRSSAKHLDAARDALTIVGFNQ